MKKQWMIVPWISLSFLLLGLVRTFCSEFSYEVQWHPDIKVIFLVAGIVTFLVIQLKGRYALAATLTALAGAGIFVLKQLEHVENDLQTILYYINQQSISYSGRTAVDYAVDCKGTTDGGLLLMLIGTGFITYIAVVAFCLHNRAYGLGVIFFVPAIGMWFGKTPDIAAIAFLFIGVLTALAWISFQESGGRHVFRRRRYQENNSHLAACAILALIMGISLFGANFIGTKTQNQILKNSRNALIKQHKFERNMSMKVQEMAQVLRGKLGLDSEGRLSNAAPFYTGKTVMEITVWERPSEDMYFRGYIGTSYRNGKWSEGSNEKVQQMFQTDYQVRRIQSLNYLAFYGLGNEQLVDYFDAITSSVWEDAEAYLPVNEQQMTIKYTGFGKISKYAYLPYFSNVQGVKNEEGLECLEMNGDKGILKSQDKFFLKYYPLDMLDQEMFCESMRLSTKNEWYDVDIPNQELDDYIAYVQSEYKQIPERGLEEFKKFAASYDIRKESEGDSTLDIKEDVINILGSNASYSTSLSAAPANQDYVENFLLSQKKGYCEHFATAGTLLLRYYGVPARYVSGYRISPGAFERNRDGSFTAKVIDSDAHAWSEFFYGTIGWVPAEMTPASGAKKQDYKEFAPSRTKATRAPRTSKQPKTENTKKPDEKQQEKKQTAVPETSKPALSQKDPNKSSGENVSGKNVTGEKKVLRVWIVVVLLTIFIVCILWMLLRYQRKLNQNRLKSLQEKPNQYLLERLSQLFMFIRICGIHNADKMTDIEWLTRVSEACGNAILEEERNIVCKIIQKAGFSGKNITQEELRQFCNVADKIEWMLYDRQNKWKKKYLSLVRGEIKKIK